MHNRIGVLTLVSLTCLVWAVPARGAVLIPSRAEQKFEVLQIGTHTYRNVTVTTKSTNYVFLLHADGIQNIKVAELPPDVLQQLGYAEPAAVVKTNAATAWAKSKLAKLNTTQLDEASAQFRTRFASAVPGAAKLDFPPLTPRFLLAVAGALVLLYLFHSFCCSLICKKAGKPGGALVWIPVLQLIPMLRAADMSGWWFLAFFVPVLNIVAQLLWSLKIADARGKTALVGILLFIPGTSIFAFLYLAFANGVALQEKPAARPIEIMALETT